MPKQNAIEILQENIGIEHFREKLWLAVLTTPYVPIKPYGSTEYISKKWNWPYLCFFLFLFFFFFFCYLIRFEPEQKLTISCLNWLLDYFLFSSFIFFFFFFSCQFFEFLHVRGFREAGHPMYYELFLDRPLRGTNRFQNYRGSCRAPTVSPLAPTPMLHVPIHVYALQSVLKGSPFLVHRTDRPTTAP